MLVAAAVAEVAAWTPLSEGRRLLLERFLADAGRAVFPKVDGTRESEAAVAKAVRSSIIEAGGGDSTRVTTFAMLPWRARGAMGPSRGLPEDPDEDRQHPPIRPAAYGGGQFGISNFKFEV
jgi:hypothetical protein